ncbi:MAG: prolipoprotein diacylglyceryl transferase [Abditibacteriota bacterium]|nr:prolipoprotein diacylglyceryl transferase [Abditibacteriota bacterium]
MHADLFHIGNLTVHAYGFFLAIGFIVGMYRMIKIAPKYNIDKNTLIDLGIYFLIAGIVGSRLLYVLTNLSSYTLGEAFCLWKGGLSFHGAIVAGVLVGLIFSKIKKINFLTILDIVCPSVCIGYGFTRIGCFLNGCCYGIDSSMPWACNMLTDHGISPCEPVQLYACVISFIMFWTLTKFEFKKDKPGYVFTWYLIFYGFYRYLIEFIRHHVAGDYIFPYVTGGQLLSILMLIAGILILCIRFRKDNQ